MAKLDLEKAGSAGTSPAARRTRQSGLLGRSSGGHPGQSGWRAFLAALPFITPSFFGVVMFLVVPVVVLFYLSFENWNLINPATFNGFNNYINIFRFDDEGRIAEEWVRTDNRSLLRQLGAEGA